MGALVKVIVGIMRKYGISKGASIAKSLGFKTKAIIVISVAFLLFIILMEKIKDFLLSLIETYSSKLSCWAWDKRWKYRNTSHADWIKGYNKWKTISSNKRISITNSNTSIQKNI